MTRIFPILLFIGLAFWSCEDSNDEDKTPPSVTVTYPQNNSLVYEVVSINCISTDNEAVEKVELWLDGVSTGILDTTEPYSFNWNTTLIDNRSYTITVRSYDKSGNTTDSAPIVLTVDNTNSYPSSISITSVFYDTTKMTIQWQESSDGDFLNYKLLYAQGDSEYKDTLETYTEKSNTVHQITQFNPLLENWFWIQVTDTLGYSTIGNGQANQLDMPPDTSVIDSIIYENGAFVIRWLSNNNNDFSSYILYESQFENMLEKNIIFETENSNDSIYNVFDIDDDELRYYQIITKDFWGLESPSNIQYGHSHDWIMKYYGGELSDGGRFVRRASDGGYILLGNTESYGNGDYDFWLVKTNHEGDVEWDNTYGGSDRESVSYFEQINDGFIIVGETRSDRDDWGVYVVKADLDGNQLWDWIGYSDLTDNDGNLMWSDNYGEHIIQTQDGGFIVSGATNRSMSLEGWLVKIDNNGNKIWSEVFEDFGPLTSVIQDIDGGYIATTYINSEPEWLLKLLKVDSQGSYEWNKSFDYSTGHGGKTILISTNNGGYAILNTIYNGETLRYDLVLIKVDNNGNELWSQVYEKEGENFSFSLEETDDLGFLILCNVDNPYMPWLMKTNSDGQVEWESGYNLNNQGSPGSAFQRDDGKYAIIGTKYSGADLHNQMFLITTDLNGNTLPGGN